ncbi:MAG: hypothetical protein U5N27_24095 [Rhizobium sp.]|nr:hypothetical protein [Rhizobium sp.]
MAGAVKQQMAAAVWTLPIFFVQMVGSVVLLTALSWPLTLPVLVWMMSREKKAASLANGKTAGGHGGSGDDDLTEYQTVSLREDSEAGLRVMERSMTSSGAAGLRVVISHTVVIAILRAWGLRCHLGDAAITYSGWLIRA